MTRGPEDQRADSSLRMQRLGRVWSYLGRYLSLEDELARINAVTLSELREVWEAFPFAPRLVSTLRPG